MKEKIRKKSSAFWKHGKHKGLLEISINKNKKKKKKDLEVIDISSPDWSRKI